MKMFNKRTTHKWKKAHEKPWLRTFGNVDVIECKDCHIFANVEKEK